VKSGIAIMDLNVDGLALVILLVAVLWNAMQDLEKRESRWSNRLASTTVGKSDAARNVSVVREPVIDRFDDNLASKLADICGVEPSFDATWFLDSVRIVYETVLAAFAQGDCELLKELLDTGAYDTFAQEIARREAETEHFELTFIGLTRADIVDAGVFNDVMRITVVFESELVMATYNPAGTLISGDPVHVTTSSDLWTFIRNRDSRNPGWKLAVTEANDRNRREEEQLKQAAQIEMV
jgi:predicted lipid-binding transport protein (Tim44 family)